MPSSDDDIGPLTAGDVLKIVGFTAGTVLLLRFGRGLFNKRLIGPFMRWGYRKSPLAKKVVRVTVGDVPMIHAEEVTGEVIGETAFTAGFWTIYFRSQLAQRGFESTEEAIKDTSRVVFRLLVLNRLFGTAPDPPPPAAWRRVYVDSDAITTTITSESGRVSVATFNAWRIDP